MQKIANLNNNDFSWVFTEKVTYYIYILLFLFFCHYTCTTVQKLVVGKISPKPVYLIKNTVKYYQNLIVTVFY